MKSSSLFLAAVTALALLGEIAHAQMIQPDLGNQQIQGVTVLKGAHVKINNQDVYLTTVGAAIRPKKVLGMNIKVYVGQILFSEPQLFKKKDDQGQLLASTDGIKTGVITMTFLRSVDGPTVFKAYRDSFVVNKANMNDPAIMGFLDAVRAGSDAFNGKTMTLLLNRDSNTQESVTYEDALGKVATITGGPGFLHAVYAMWLGLPLDEGVVSFKQDIMKWPSP